MSPPSYSPTEIRVREERWSNYPLQSHWQFKLSLCKRSLIPKLSRTFALKMDEDEDGVNANKLKR